MDKFERIVGEEQSRMLKQHTQYQIPERYIKMVRVLLAPGEYVVIGAKQAFPKSLAPGIIVATNKRILVMKQSFWSLYFGHNIVSPSDFLNIHYKQMTEITLRNGRLFCTIVIRVIGGKDIEFENLIRKQATRLVGFLERVVLENESEEQK